MAKRLIKYFPIHEQIILGSMLKDPKLRVKLCKRLTTSDFFANKHKYIFAALVSLTENNLDYIPSTIKSFLPNDEAISDLDYIKKLESLDSQENIEYHIKKAKWDNIRNVILSNNLSELELVLKDPRTDPEDAIKCVNDLQNNINSTLDDTYIEEGPGLSAIYQANLYARETGQHIRTTGYDILDSKLTNPFAPGQLTVIAAAPSIGKTTFSLNMAIRQSKQWKVGYLSWEGGIMSAIDTLCACTLDIPLDILVKYPNRLSNEKKIQLEEFLDTVFDNNARLSFLKPPPKKVTNRNSLWEINDRVLDWFESQLVDWNRDIIYWDLFEKKLPDRRPQAISWALDRAQEIAKTYNVHLALLHQITFKEVEKKMDKRPTRALLKGSGGYIEVPDCVFGLYRHAIYQPNLEDNEIELFCLKQRYGQFPFKIVFDWNGNRCKVFGGREEQMVICNEESYDDI